MDKKVISKIQKLISLAGNNPSEQEAQEAMLRAQQLMAKHHISMETIKKKESSKKKAVMEWYEGGQSSQWMRELGHVICDNFRCNLAIGPRHGLAFIGLKEDVVVCIQVFNFASSILDKNMKKLRRQYRKQGLSTKGVSGTYALGFIKGLRDKFRDQVEKNNWGLILVKDKMVMDYTKKVVTGKPASKGRNIIQNHDKSIYDRGYKDGKSLEAPQKCLK